MYRLYRDATRYEKGHYIKDLNHLNRDLAKVIAIDVDANALKENPDNAIIIPKWNGDPQDTTLLDMMPMLECTVSTFF
jgi:import inner membrane translocase subunit TIM50